MKFYNILAIIGFLMFLVSCIISNSDLSILGIGLIMLSVPFSINDARKPL